jgi:hypothetical protein
VVRRNCKKLQGTSVLSESISGPENACPPTFNEASIFLKTNIKFNEDA